MDRREIGQALRLAGPLLQIVALIGLFRPGLDQVGQVACYIGFALGFLLVLAGVALVRLSPRRRTPTKDHELDLDR